MKKALDELIEKLEREADEAFDKMADAEDDYVHYYDGYEDGLRRAIELIRDGG